MTGGKRVSRGLNESFRPMNVARIIEPCLLRNGRQRLAPIDVFRARAEARAALFVAGELDLHEAIDVLQAAALASGLVAATGQDAVQAIMDQAFGRART